MQVNNVSPTAVLSNSGPVNAGAPVLVSFSNPSDPSPTDTAAGFRYSIALSQAALATSYADASTAQSVNVSLAGDISNTDFNNATTTFAPVVSSQVKFATPGYAHSHGGALHPHSGFTTSVSQLQVESRGSVHVGSADPSAAPVIRYNYLATENDRRVMVEGLKVLRRIAAAPPLSEYILDEYLPGPKVQTDAEWLAFCREAGSTVFHPTSTCRIGAVVDEHLRVKGVSNLRVVDASVMPAVPSGNINAAVLALAERGADLIRQGRA